MPSRARVTSGLTTRREDPTPGATRGDFDRPSTPTTRGEDPTRVAGFNHALVSPGRTIQLTGPAPTPVCDRCAR